MATRMTKSENMLSQTALSENATTNTVISTYHYTLSSSQDITNPQTSFKTVEHSSARSPHSTPSSARRRRVSLDNTTRSALDSSGLSAISEAATQNVAPYLAKHIPTKYNPEGGMPSIASTMEKKPTYCNRHRPDTKCWRQANEPTMEELQNELNVLDTHDQQGISHVWSLFSTAPAKQRKLMLQGILAVCCFPQLSFVSATVRDLIKIDFISMLPTELSFKILSYLDTVSLCKAAQVCRGWNELAEDDVVWHKMCEQHIAKKCKKCGWGLPLLDRKRLFKERRVIERRARGLAIETANTSREASEGPCDHGEIIGNKRPSEDAFESPSKRIRIEPTNQLVVSRPPWKEVYKTRFKIGTNWKYGRHRLKILKGHRNGVMCLQFQDNILATGSYDATIKIWDLDTGKELRTLEGHTSGVRCLQFYNCQLISGAMDKTIRIWNWKTGQCVRVLSGPTGDVLSVNFNSRYLCSGGKDNIVRVWNFEEKINYILRGHSDFVNSVRLDGPSRTLFSGADDGTVKLWDLNNGHLLKTFKGHVGGVQQVVLLPQEFEVDEFDLVDCEHASDSEEEAARSRNRSPVPSSLPKDRIFPNDPTRPNPPSFILTASLDSTIRLWHVPTERCLRTFFGHLEGIWALAADNLRVVSGAEDRMVKIWDPRSGKCERTFTGHAGPVTCVGLSGDLLVTGSEDCEIRVMEFGPVEED